MERTELNTVGKNATGFKPNTGTGTGVMTSAGVAEPGRATAAPVIIARTQAKTAMIRDLHGAANVLTWAPA
jgi:hypothetical protein